MLVPRAWNLASLLLAGALALVAASAQAAPAEVNLEVSDTFRFGNTTALMGEVSLEEAPVEGVGFVNVRSLQLPGTTVYVCPQSGGEQDQTPPLPEVEEACRDEDRYREPTFTVRGRTWIQTRGSFTPTDPIGGTILMVWSGQEGPGVAATLPSQGLELASTEDAFAFTPTRASSEIHVEEAGEGSWYNGTDWMFYVERASTMGIQADGVHANASQALSINVRQAPLDGFRSANDPYVLLQVQDAALGPDRREPVRNMTRVFNEHGRIVHMTNGALMGTLEGDVGAQEFDGQEVSLVRVTELDALLGDAGLEGQGEVVFTRSQEGFAPGTGDPASVPWLLVGALWLAAVAGVVLRDAGKRPGWSRYVGVPLGVVAFLAWDALLYSLVGISALSLLAGDATLGEWLAVFGFEAVALAVAWGLVYLPGRIALERALPERFVGWARPAWGLALVGAMALWPATVLVMGELVARL